MKSQIVKCCLISLLAVWINTWETKAQYYYTDPITGAAVTVQTEIVGGHLDNSAKYQKSTAATNAAITGLVDEIRSYDQIMLDYLKKANSVFDGIFHAADAVEMAGNVISNLGDCLTAARRHPKGLLITSMVNKRYTKIATETTSLIANINNFVKKSGEGNLLNSRERLDILYDVHSRMRRLNRETQTLYWEILSSDWEDLFRELNPDLYYSISTDERLYRNAKRRIDQMGLAW